MSRADDKRILVVDDEPVMAFAFKSAMEDNGFKEQVDTYNNLLVALKNFTCGLYSLMILDVAMPQMDGFTLC